MLLQLQVAKITWALQDQTQRGCRTLEHWSIGPLHFALSVPWSVLVAFISFHEALRPQAVTVIYIFF